MKHIQSFTAVIFVGFMFLIFFYMNMNLETTNSRRAMSKAVLKQHDLQEDEVDVKTKRLEERDVTTSAAELYNVSVSDLLKKTIPHNGAYWNRLLYLSLKMRDDKNMSSRRSGPWSSCRENQELLITNVHDFPSYPVLFQLFVASMKCRAPPVIKQPNKCVSRDPGHHIFLLFAIKSSPGNFKQRQVVRETWGHEGKHVRTIFLLGSAGQDDPDFSFLLSMEDKHYGDILQWDFNESFLNLTLKMNMVLHWAVRRCPDISFVFSGDDDVFVNTPALLQYLRSLSPSKASQLYTGQVINHATPHRDPKNKYYVPQSFYDGPYPAYCGGGGFVFSGALLLPLYSIFQVIPLYPIDDAYIGMCFMALGVSPQPHNGFRTFDISDKDRENVCVHKNIILVHRRSPQEIKRLWRSIHSHLLTC
ncbi:N-acetyllactosaminide beta-1,3-N-acetylglucosaminyltransferase 2 [Gouania willdenowi]|nr:N-acetyllactosaminide beta-1,3-N-acetylglucosaminyltransferase 2-like [Gouania willdenowi]